MGAEGSASSANTTSGPVETTSAETTQASPDDGADPTCGDGKGQAGVYCFKPIATAIERTPVRIGDFNYDGHQDVLTQLASAQLEVWFGDGSGQFPSMSPFVVPPPWDANVGYLVVGQLDGAEGDDILSLRLLADDEGVVLTLRNDGTGEDFSNITQTILDVDLYGGIEPGALLDIDGDSTLDLLATAAASSKPALQPFVNDGSGGFLKAAPSLSHEALQGCMVVGFVEISGVEGLRAGLAALPSGCNDTRPSNSPIQLIRPAGKGSVAFVGGPLSGEDPRGLAAGDFDGDGLDDLISWTQGDRAFNLYKGLASGDFASSTSVQEAAACPDCPCLNCMGTSDYVRMLASNLDGDDDADLIAVGDSAHFAMKLSGTTTWGWLTARPLLSGDFNEDGFTDFLSRNGASIEAILSNP